MDLAGIPHEKRWATVKAPIRAIIVTLLELGWRPYEATEWESPEGNLWRLGEGSDNSDYRPLLWEVERSVTEIGRAHV